jgi:hypothetical protein
MLLKEKGKIVNNFSYQHPTQTKRRLNRILMMLTRAIILLKTENEQVKSVALSDSILFRRIYDRWRIFERRRYSR